MILVRRLSPREVAALLSAGVMALALSSALAQDGAREGRDAADATTKLPFVPFLDAEVGDWAVFLTREVHAGGDRKPLETTRLTRHLVTEIRASAAGNMIVATSEQLETAGVTSASESTRDVSLVDPPTLSSFLGSQDPFAVKDLATSDDRLVIAGEAFRCKKLSFVADEKERGRSDVSIWFGSRVGAMGLLAWSREGTRDGVRHSSRTELLGYGSRDTCLWGSRFEVLARDPKAVERALAPTDARRLPSKAFGDVAAGDWTFLAGKRLARGRETKVGVFRLLTVQRATDRVLGFELGGSPELKSIRAFGTTLELPRKDGPTVALLDLPGKPERIRVSRSSLEDATYDLGPERLACQKASYTVTDHREIWRVVVWTAPRVKATGIVAIETTTRLVDGTGEEGGFRLEVAGYGSKDRTEWGKSPEELAAEK